MTPVVKPARLALRIGARFRYCRVTVPERAEGRTLWPLDAIGTASPTASNLSEFGLLLVFVAALVALIWWAYATGHIKHIDTVPPPITAPSQAQAP